MGTAIPRPGKTATFPGYIHYDGELKLDRLVPQVVNFTAMEWPIGAYPSSSRPEAARRRTAKAMRKSRFIVAETRQRRCPTRSQSSSPTLPSHS